MLFHIRQAISRLSAYFYTIFKKTFNNPLNKTSQPLYVSLRQATMGMVIISCLLIGGVAVSLQLYFSHSLATRAAHQLFNEKALSVEEQLRELDIHSAGFMRRLNLFKGIGMPMPDDRAHPIVPLLAEVMREEVVFLTIYLGYGNGDLMQLINLEAQTNAHHLFKAFPDERWLLVHIHEHNGQRIRQLNFLDKQLNTLRKSATPTDYQATHRQWYIQAMQHQTTIKTPPYAFAHIQDYGSTYAKRIKQTDIVVAIDITVDGLSEFLHRKADDPTEGMAFAFDRNGNIIARSDYNDTIDLKTMLEDDMSQAVRDQVSQQLQSAAQNVPPKGQIEAITIDDEDFYLFSKAIHTPLSQDNYFGYLLPEDNLVNPYLARIGASTAVTLLALLGLIPIIYQLASRFNKPVDALRHQAHFISHQEYDKVRLLNTRISDYNYLSQRMVNMAKAIQQHEQQQKDLTDSIIQLIAAAIDDKSRYTGGHCERVPEIALLLAKQAHESKASPFKNFQLASDQQWREFRTAAWLHDCGKITTPEHIVDKGTKLEANYNRLHEIRMRFEVIWRDAEIQMYQQLIDHPDRELALRTQLEKTHRSIRDDFTFIAECNQGSEYMSEQALQRLNNIARQTWQRNLADDIGLSEPEAKRYPQNPATTLPITEYLISDKPQHIIPRESPIQLDPAMGITMPAPEHLYNQGEIHNLSIRSGTLTVEDRYKVNEHTISTIRMLESLPFTSDLAQVPRYASTHHEHLNGQGYPRGLSADALSIPERILAIADIFEALTACDRPYKKAKPLSEALKIMSFMVKDQHLDGELFKLFLESDCHRIYANKYLQPEQMDDVQINDYL